MLRSLAFLVAFVFIALSSAIAQPPDTYSGTKPLTLEGDIASEMIDGIDRFLLREIEQSVDARAKHWKRDFSSPEAYAASIEPNRKRLAHILGVRDARVPFDAPELIATTDAPALVGKGERFDVFAVRWPAFGDVHGEGLLLVPTGNKPVADIIAIPDADQTPEQICGLAEGLPATSQFARRFAESGCRVLVPTLISRAKEMRAPPGQTRGNKITSREYIYRSAFELGRHLIGYEVQKVLAGVDWFVKDAGDQDPKIGVIGYGEGGMLAMYAAALDTRIDACGVSGYYGPRDNIWEQPLDRNVYGLLAQFGDAEVASLIAPRKLVLETRSYPSLVLTAESGAPAELRPVTQDEFYRELERLISLTKPFENWVSVAATGPEKETPFIGGFLASRDLLGGLGVKMDPHFEATKPPEVLNTTSAFGRQERQLLQLDRHSQWLLRESPFVRKEFMKNLDTSSVEAYEKSAEAYRDIFRDEIIGSFDHDLLPFNARSRKSWETEKWTGYEVMLDVFPDVFAYGVLLIPKDLKEGEKRPVVVCQHGLEGRPTDVFLGDHGAYHDFAAKLCERGFITFAPQNIYIFKDRFRTLQRKANPLGKTLFSVMVPQHQQIVNWLKTQPNVDPDRIAFYGLSYGGKSAMRIPALVTDYCLSICSADFNEWVLKNASTRHNFSYVWTGEYEIFEFDLGSTFNYAEMAYLICPRPFMVERGHFDGVGEDEWVGYEYAKIRHMYAAKLFIPERTEIEWFYGQYKGVHTINGQGTYDFLHKHLDWPKP
ncbi:MAG: dienelactone hydrolase family protein [Planctomycetota bacterium]|nr:dienelactone hydrolase family protein [Planctomycetota bacterium]